MNINRFESVLKAAVLGVFVGLMSASAYGMDQADSIVQAARLKTVEGDLEAATTLYQEALKHDNENTEIRRELAKVLVEAKTQEPQD